MAARLVERPMVAKTRIRLVLGVAAVVAVVVAARFLPVDRWAEWLIAKEHGAGAWGTVGFAAAYVVAPLLLLPGSLLTLGAGFLYGRLWGTLLVSPASVLAAAIAFLLGRTALRRRVERRIATDSRLRAIDAAVAENGFRVVFLLRLSPVVPFSLLNYALGATHVRFWTYVAASFLGMLPGTFLYVSLGAVATSAAQLRGAHGGLLPLIAGLAATVAVVVLLTLIGRRALRDTLQEREAA
jgi:uncharacterized membrane protein YdjX (TVP38/TMEM64 family)